MLTSKQRAYLKGIASTYETIFQIGKGAFFISKKIDPTAVSQATSSEVVQVIGSKFVLFKRNPKEPVIQDIPKSKSK